MSLQAITPFRVLDSRSSNGGHNAAFTANETYALPIIGTGAVPSFGVAAVFINITVVTPATATGGYLTIYATGTTRPTASNLNFNPGTIVANTALVGLGSDGSISIYSGYAAGEHVIIDVQGWVAAASTQGVGPSVPFDQATLSAPDSVKARQILNSAMRYTMLTWLPGDAQPLLAADLGVSPNGDATRRLGMQALAISTAVATGAYQAPSVDFDAAAATTLVDTLVNHVAAQHLTNRLGGWGDGWQTPMWAALIGRAAWYLWPQMSPQTQTLVARVVAREADYASRQKLKYYRNAAGTIINPGDSGAEEVSWWAGAMQVGVVMLPNNPNVGIWAKSVAQFALAAWGRPVDVTNSTVINGAPVSAWIGGSNVEANGIVINHNRPASDYSTTTYQNLDAAPLYTLAGLAIPQAVTALLGPVYAALAGAQFGDGSTTYVLDTGAIYYPVNNDWGNGQVLPYALSDAQALTYGYDPGTAASYLNLHLDAVLAQQARYSDGHMYTSTEYNYEGREEHAAQLASQLYLTLYMRDHGLVSYTNSPLEIG